MSDVIFFWTPPKIPVEDATQDNSTAEINTNNAPKDTNACSRIFSSLFKSTRQFLILPDIRQAAVPLLSAVVGVLIVSMTFHGARGTYTFSEKDCDTNLDADISGDDVRMSIWAQIGMLIVISTMGIFHAYDTGLKEVASGLVLTHVSLVIAIVVQMRRGTLSSVDAAIGAAILDAQNVALQIPLTAKETLAARWQLILLLPIQTLGLVVLPFIVVGLDRHHFASEDCRCFYVFWWS